MTRPIMHETLQMPHGDNGVSMTGIGPDSSNLDFYEFSPQIRPGPGVKTSQGGTDSHPDGQALAEQRFPSSHVSTDRFAQSLAAASRRGPSHDARGRNSSLQISIRPVKRRRGGKIYFGCATCRQRKIKCDLRQPTCYNCERSRHHICDGYVAQDNGICPPRSQNVNSVNGEMTEVPTEVTEVQSSNPISPEQDSNESDHLLHEDGPVDMSGFQVHELPYAEVLDDLSAFQNWTDASMVANAQDSTVPGFNFSPLLFPQGPFPNLPMDTLDISYLAESYLLHEGAAEPGIQFSQEDTGSNKHEQPGDTSPRPSRRQSPRPVGRQASTPLAPLIADSDSSRLSQVNKKLLYHYQTHVSQLMMPTAAPSHNPWLKLYLPIALQEPRTTAREALFHAILAVAAFNHAELHPSDAISYRIQAVEHSEEAARLIKSVVSVSGNKSRDSIKDPLEKRALLAAALTMTTIEVFSGANEGKGYEHLRVAKDVVELTGGINWWLSDAANVTLLQIFRCLRIISYTSGWSEPQDIRLDKQKDGPAVVQVESPSAEDAPADEAIFSSSSPPCEYTLDVSFGISMKTLWCLNKIVDLEATKCAMAIGDRWSAENIDDLTKLENELYMLMDNPSAFSNHSTHSPPHGDSLAPENPGISNVVTEEIKENHVWAFHYSVALFFRRALCDGKAHVRPSTVNTEADDSTIRRPTGQYLVSKALEYLENIDALTIDIAVANTLWPGFIAAVEAVDTELRHRALVWFARAKRHGIGNIAKAKALVLEVWRRVDRQTYVSSERKNLRAELGPVDWRDVMREKGMYIMLT